MSLYKTQKKPVETFEITKDLSVGLFADGKVMTMIRGVPFVQCRKLVITARNDAEIGEKIGQYTNIDEYIAGRNIHDQKLDDIFLEPREELFGHASNLQAWVESGYALDVIDTRIAFPILAELSKYDQAAKNALYYEVERRWAEGNDKTRVSLAERVLGIEDLDLAFFSRLFGMADNMTKYAVLSMDMPTRIRAELEKRFGMIDPKRLALSFFLRVGIYAIKRSEEIEGLMAGQFVYGDRLFEVFSETQANDAAYGFIRNNVTFAGVDFIEESTGAQGIEFIINAECKKKGSELVEYAADVISKIAKYKIEGFSSKEEARKYALVFAKYKIDWFSSKEDARKYADMIGKIVDAIKALPYDNVDVENILIKIIEVNPGVDEFAKKFVDEVGRGFILSTYDGKEHKVVSPKGTYYIYEME